ncbi:hypothetical protein LINPERPRIM_LOCUS21558, partial [Linum perenne]
MEAMSDFRRHESIPRLILDASPIANELIDARRRNGRSGLILKFDYEKAY